MALPYVGEIRMFAGNFAPSGWAFCDGQILPISENDTLFQLIGTTYGGNGQDTFQLPDMRGRIPVHIGSGGGDNYVIGEIGGVEEVTLSVQQIPIHSHALLGSNGNGSQSSPQGNFLASATGIQPYVSGETPGQPLAPQSLASIGGSQPHSNMQPYLCVNFIISLFGIFPSQT